MVWNEALILAGILCTATVVRLYRIDLTWYFLDQVRDVSTVIGIVSGKEFPMVGPLIGWTSGHLGPLYFYLITPPFLFTQNPLAGFIFTALANVLGVVVCYRFTREYFGVAVAVCASALFSVFPLSVVSARVLWNPALVPLFTLLFMQALFAAVVRGRSRAIIWMGACLGVLTQLHLTTAALGVVAILALMLWRPKVGVRHVLAGLGAFLVLYAPYLAHELSHHVEDTRAILGSVGMNQGGGGPLALPNLLRNLVILYRPAIAGFVVSDPWPRAFLGAFSLLYWAEAGLFCAGIGLGVWRVVRDWKDRSPSAISTRRAIGLLLFWLFVPVVLLGTRRTALWWYYLDLLYPSQFIFAGIALTSISSAPTNAVWTKRALACVATCFVLAVIATQVWFQIGLQQRIEKQGELVFDVRRFSVASAASSLGILPSLPYGYRLRLLRALLDFGLPPDAFSERVHGTVLGRPEESEYLLRYLASRTRIRPGAQAGSESHYLVTKTDTGSHIQHRRSERIGPYALIEYRPLIDYRSWRCAVSAKERPDFAGIGSWERLPLPATSLTMELVEKRKVLCEGILRVAEGQATAALVVSLTGQGQLQVVRGESQGRQVGPVARRSWESPSLYSTSEAVFALDGLRPGENVFRFEVTGSGRILGMDVYEQGSAS